MTTGLLYQHVCRELNMTEHVSFLLTVPWAGKGDLQRGWSGDRQVNEEQGEGRGRSLLGMITHPAHLLPAGHGGHSGV